jgi:TPR repeat protein
MRFALLLLLWVLSGAAAQAQSAVERPATYGEAIRWYQTAATAGSAKAQYLLGRMLETGKGRSRDEAAAVQWYRRAAAQGHARAQFRLGWMRQNGLGVDRDPAKAASWYAGAAAQGVPEAAFNLGYLYETGDGVEADPEKAGIYYRQAAEEGLGGAQMNLGLLLASRAEDGATRREGFLWLSLAAARNVPEAAAARDALAASLTSSEIDAVRRRIAERKDSGRGGPGPAGIATR